MTTVYRNSENWFWYITTILNKIIIMKDLPRNLWFFAGSSMKVGGFLSL
jgi:hypothetical protein